MDVVGHQHARVGGAAVAQSRLPQSREVGAVVDLLEEARLAIVPALHDMLRNTGKIRARLARHGIPPENPSLPRAPPTVCQQPPQTASERGSDPVSFG